ncbi:hypothetical protein KR222_001023, partial [Zaprionus bogoriensis]
TMSYFGVYMPPSEAGFAGSRAQCAGSIAALSAGKGVSKAPKYEDPEYPPDSPHWLIFTEKSKALDMLRRYKEARLREFPNREQAECYVQFGFESIESLKRYGKAKTTSIQMPTTASSGFKSASGGSSSPLSSSPTSSSLVSSSLAHAWTGSNSVVNGSSAASSNSNNSSSNSSNTSSSNSSSSSSSSSSLNAERPPFRAPSKQELVEFRKQIEAGNYERVKNIVWENPRFLISSGDTPTSLKEGYRYNAMHICAQGNQARVAELILKIISDRDFTQLYAGKKSSGEMCAALNENLLDYYLNMPDKGRGETPLHFAVKNGHVAVVEVLTSYPQCKSLRNSEGNYPKDIICQRQPNASPELIAKLELLLSEPYYVPVLRAVSNELPPQIGQPFTPTQPPILQDKTDESDHLSVDLVISALAGPMPREQALCFFRRWKTPPRLGSNKVSPLANSPLISPLKTPNKAMFNKGAARRIPFTLTPPKKPNEEPNGNHQPQPEPLLHNGDPPDIEKNNNNNDCAYAEGPTSAAERHWSAQQMPSTPIRLMKPDLFMKYRDNSSPMEESPDRLCDLGFNMSNVSDLNDSFRERHIKNSDIEKGLEVVGRQLARQERHEWREYWDFLDAFLDISTPGGLARLEGYLMDKHVTLLADRLSLSSTTSQLQQFDFIAERNRSNNIAAAVGAAGVSSSPVTQVMTPYTCVEKSLQVFAKRITKTLINNIGNMVSINDTLLSELKRLKSLIVSFKDDARFITVNFGKVHSRIAHLVASYIAHNQEVGIVRRCQLMILIQKLLAGNGDRREHLQCVCASMLILLDQAPVVQLPDALKTEELCLAAWQAEKCCSCLWDANLSRKTSRRKRAESLRAQAQEVGSSGSSSVVTTALTEAVATLRTSVASSTATSTPVATDSNDCQLDEAVFVSIEPNLFIVTICINPCFFYSPQYECITMESSDEEEEVFFTPPQSRSTSFSCDDSVNRYELFIFGKEPTKRDVDVLFALVHVDIDKENLPCVHAWLTAMSSFSTDEMDL